MRRTQEVQQILQRHKRCGQDRVNSRRSMLESSKVNEEARHLHLFAQLTLQMLCWLLPGGSVERLRLGLSFTLRLCFLTVRIRRSSCALLRCSERLILWMILRQVRRRVAVNFFLRGIDELRIRQISESARVRDMRGTEVRRQLGFSS